MSETLSHWSETRARKHSPASSLPSLNKADTLSIKAGEASLRDFNLPPQSDADIAREHIAAIEGIIGVSGQEYGRSDPQRKLYLESMGEQYGAIDFVERARKLTSLIQQIEEAGIDIDSQPDDVKEAIIADINSLNVLSDKLWGRVEQDRLEGMIARVRKRATETIANHNAPDYKREAAQRLLQSLPEVPEEKTAIKNFTPSHELLETYNPYILRKYADLLELIPEDKKELTKEELCDIFNQGIKVMAEKWGLTNALRWKSELSSRRTNISVDQDKERIWIPESQIPLTSLKASKLMVHELGGHLLRNLLGELTGDAFVATGMRSRSAAEESLLAILESTVDGKAREAGLSFYIALGLGKDILQTGKKWTGDELEPLLTDIQLVHEDKEPKVARSIGIKTAFRVIRGMPSIVINGTRHQALYGADIKYAIGQEQAVRWLETHKHDPAALDRVMGGKFAYNVTAQAEYAGRLYDEHIDGKFRVPSAR